MLKNTNYLISIIVPTFNRAHLIADTLESILHQKFINWECIIIDDCSEDNTTEIVDYYLSLDKRFYYFRNLVNSGISYSRNFGLKQAKGSFVQFLDSDDILGKDNLIVKFDFFSNNDEVDVVYTSARYFYNNDINNISSYGYNNFYIQHEISMFDNACQAMFIRNPLVIGSGLYKKELFSKIDHFDLSLHLYEDWDFHIRCALSGAAFHYLGFNNLREIVFIRLHQVSLIKQSLDSKYYLEKLFKKHKKYFFVSNSFFVSKSILGAKIYFILRNCLNFYRLLIFNFKGILRKKFSL